MFTGIVKAFGVVTKTISLEQGLRIEVEVSQLDVTTISIGDSIAVNGVCLTVADINNTIVRFDVSQETLSKTLLGNWKESQQVNLETALTLNTPLGGHLVFGHVDGVAELWSMNKGDDDFTELVFSVDKVLGKYLAVKGSVTLDGISLTTNDVRDDNERTCFSLTIVPHTLMHTNLGALLNLDNPIGEKMHIEIDQVARYVHRLMAVDN